MADDSEKLGELVSAGRAAQDNRDPHQLELFDQLVQIERERIQLMDRRLDVALQAVQASDAADQRQYEYHKQRLESNERLAKARLSLGSRMAAGVGVAAVLFLFAVLYMMFFGTSEQGDRAQTLLTWFFTALGGGGLFVAAQRVARWLMKS